MAIAIVGSLLLAVLVLVMLPALTGAGDRAPVASQPAAAPLLAPTEGPLPSATEEDDPRIAAAQAALSAWGEFVADGDLDHLKPWFVEGGPQFRQLAQEAPELATQPGEAYAVTTEEESVAMTGEAEAVVSSKVTWRRPAENIRAYEWEMVLRRSEDDRWLLWTVRDIAAS